MTNPRDELIRLLSVAVGQAAALSADLLAEATDIMADIQVPVRTVQALIWRADQPTITVTGPGTIEAVENMSDEPDIAISVRIQRARDYATIRREHWESVYGGVVGFLDTSLPVTSYRNLIARAVVEHFTEAFQAGTDESGNDTIAAEDDSWLTARMNQELEYVVSMFATLKEIRAAGDYDADAIARDRADGYTATLDGIYAEGRMRASTNKVLEFGGQSGKVDPCETCTDLMGRRMRVKTILKRGLIPTPGNPNFICGAWKCRHYWFDPRTGERYSFPSSE